MASIDRVLLYYDAAIRVRVDYASENFCCLCDLKYPKNKGNYCPRCGIKARTKNGQPKIIFKGSCTHKMTRAHLLCFNYGLCSYDPMNQHSESLTLTVNRFKDKKSACFKCAGTKMCTKHKKLQKYIGEKLDDVPEKLLQ